MRVDRQPVAATLSGRRSTGIACLALAACGSSAGLSPTGSRTVTNPAATSMAGMQMGARRRQEHVRGRDQGDPTQTLGTANWQGMKIQARAMTAVPFVIFDGTNERMVMPPKHVSFHLMVDLNDARTGSRSRTRASGRQSPARRRTVYDERQWPMISEYMGPHYGNNVALPGAGSYRLSLLISPPVSARHVEYRNVWLEAPPRDDDVQVAAVVTPHAAMTMGGRRNAMPLVPEWLGIAGAAVFVAIAASHLRHLTTAVGQRRPWHACHVLIAVGMAFMYAPTAIDPFVHPRPLLADRVRRRVRARRAVVDGGAQRTPTLMWLLTAVDLGAMVCMWTTNVSASLRWALVVYLGVQASLWALDAYRRVDGAAPVINVSALSAAPRGMSLPVAATRVESLLGDLDISVSMVLMSVGMAWMFAAMQLVGPSGPGVNGARRRRGTPKASCAAPRADSANQRRVVARSRSPVDTNRDHPRSPRVIRSESGRGRPPSAAVGVVGSAAVGAARAESVEQDRPWLDRRDRQHPVGRPVVRRQPVADLPLGTGADQMQDLAVAGQRPAEHDHALCDQFVHIRSVLVPTVLVTQVTGPVPWPATLQTHGEEHAIDRR